MNYRKNKLLIWVLLKVQMKIQNNKMKLQQNFKNNKNLKDLYQWTDQLVKLILWMFLKVVDKNKKLKKIHILDKIQDVWL